MNLHEYQAKQLFNQYGIPTPAGQVAGTVEAVLAAARELGGDQWVIKAQVHAGGRGKGGGVELISGLDALADKAEALLGSYLVTPQTGTEGLPIHEVLIETPVAMEQELYLGALVDRASERIVFMACRAGGMNIEEVASNDPDAILTEQVDPAAGLQAYQCRKLGVGLGLKGAQLGQLTRIMLGLYRLFQDKDISLLEINPLVITESGDLLALDAKINLDDNALFRQKALLEIRDISQEDEKERIASEHELNYITLEGNIACMVNGAGLAMATMDLIKLQGGEPANFLDVGGGATAARVTEAFKLILSDSKVRAILVNIFGGIVRCDLIAEGIITAVREVGTELPVVVRLEGTNVEQGRALLQDSGLNVVAISDLSEAAKKVVAMVAA
ncbi:MAG: ADP-forming succinate--CoA ligase subunit beta [Gammaproteobacteria bacterium]|nr:ADP-forming succinate--CoA ligase subunit beta [Gammaproteobacteria bacterium]